MSVRILSYFSSNWNLLLINPLCVHVHHKLFLFFDLHTKAVEFKYQIWEFLSSLAFSEYLQVSAATTQ